MKDLIKRIKNSQTRTARASKQVVWSFIFQAITIAVSLLYVPTLLNYLSQEKYGIWLTLTSIIGWFSFFDIGLGNGLRNKLAEAIALGQNQLANRYVSTTYALITAVFIFILLVFFIANPFLEWSKILNCKTINDIELRGLAAVVFLFFILRFIVQLIGVIYLADQQPSVNSAVNAGSSILSLALIYILLKTTAPGNLTAVAVIVTAAPVLLFICLSLYAFSTRYRHLRPRISNIDLGLRGVLMTLGAKFFFMQVTAVILYSTSSFFISLFYGPAEVVVYNLVFKYFQLPIMLYTIILSPLWSSVTNAYVSNDLAWLNKTMKALNRVSLFFIGITLAMTFLAPYAFKIWIGDKVLVPMKLNIIMAIYTIMNIYIAPYSNFINGTGKLKMTTLLSFWGILIYIIAVFLIGRLFKDSSGVLLSVMIPYFIFTILQPYQSKRLLKGETQGIWAE
jgi:O-antigen/teichoic acid export membrane protein